MFSTEVFGQRLRDARTAAGQTQEELGQILGVRKSQISELEHGTASTTLEKLFVICEYYKISADYLLGLTDRPELYKKEKGKPAEQD